MGRSGCPHIQTVVRIAGQTPADAKCATSGLFEKASLGDLPLSVSGPFSEALFGSYNITYVNLIRTNEPHISGENVNFVKQQLCSVAAEQTRPVPLRFLDTYCS